MNNNQQAPRKKALGRGLSALLENSNTDITTSKAPGENNVTVGSVSMVKTSAIETNPFQPRTHFEFEALQELSDSIKQHGLIQPVTLRKMGYDKYQLISGERRFRASQMAGLTEIPAYIRVANDQEMLEMALVENIQRRDLDAIEVAMSFKRLMEECNLTQEEVSEKVAKPRSTVANFMRLLKLPEEIQLGIRDNKITMGHARALITLDDKARQMEIYNDIIRNSLTVRDVEELSKEIKATPSRPGVKRGTRKEPEALSFAHQKIKDELSNFFSTDVELSMAPSGKGRISIPFGSEQDLKIILEMLSLG
jgi:ParB family chromosome partitioning protein